MLHLTLLRQEMGKTHIRICRELKKMVLPVKYMVWMQTENQSYESSQQRIICIQWEVLMILEKFF